MRVASVLQCSECADPQQVKTVKTTHFVLHVLRPSSGIDGSDSAGNASDIFVAPAQCRKVAYTYVIHV